MAQRSWSSYLYHVNVQEMRPHPEIDPQNSPVGQWQPPRAKGHNVAQNEVDDVHLIGLHNYNTYSFDKAQKKLVIVFDKPIPYRDLVNCRNTSLYHDGGQIYTVDTSAIHSTIGETNSRILAGHNPGARGNAHTRGWQLLNFGHVRARHSVIGYGLGEPRLCAGHYNAWMNTILPHAHQPPAGRVLSDVNGAGNASLGGDISALVGLLAMSADPGGMHVHETLMSAVNDGSVTGWNVPTSLSQVASPGWIDRRGLVVRVWTPKGRSAERELEEYEQRELLR